MPAKIPTSHADLISGPVYITLVTTMPDGQPQATPVWVNLKGDQVWVNSAAGRQKDKNMRANRKATILAIDPQNAFRWIEVRGTVSEITEEGGVDHINELSELYTGNADYYSFNPASKGTETRVIYKITPDKVNTSG